MPKPLQVILEPAALPHVDGSLYYFVEIVNVPFVKGTQKALVITNARPRHIAERIKERVEQALHDYRRPKTRNRKKAKTSWERIAADD